MESIREAFDTKVCGSCDVLVAGGGVAGIVAALAAAMCCDFSRINIEELQNRLKKNGVRI